MDFLYFIIVGGFAGWLGSMLYKGSGSGIVFNVILGIIGAIVGGWLFGLLNINNILGFSKGSLVGSIITAAVGAFIVLLVYNMFRRKRK